MSRSSARSKKPDGDLLQLLTLLNEELIMELGKPLPHEECLPKLRDPRCPAAHNRALFDRPGEEKPA